MTVSRNDQSEIKSCIIVAGRRRNRTFFNHYKYLDSSYLIFCGLSLMSATTAASLLCLHDIELTLCFHYLPICDIIRIGLTCHRMRMLHLQPLAWKFAAHWTTHSGSSSSGNTDSDSKQIDFSSLSIASISSASPSDDILTSLRDDFASLLIATQHGPDVVNPTQYEQKQQERNQLTQVFALRLYHRNCVSNSTTTAAAAITPTSSSLTSCSLPLLVPRPPPLTLDVPTTSSPFVISIGAGVTRFGLSSNNRIFAFCTVVGRRIQPRAPGAIAAGPTVIAGLSNQRNDAYIGDAAFSTRGRLIYSCPVENGLVINLIEFNLIINEAYKWIKEMQKQDKVYGFMQQHHEQDNEKESTRHLLLAISPWHTLTQRCDIARSIFSTFRIPSLSIISDAECALFSYDRTTGIVIDIGHHITSIVPIIHGRQLRSAMIQLQIGGLLMRDYLQKLMLLLDYNFITQSEMWIVQEMLREVVSVNPHTASEQQLSDYNPNDQPVRYELPDGQEIFVPTHQLTQVYEVFYDSSLPAKVNQWKSPYWTIPKVSEFASQLTLPHAVRDAIARCPVDVQSEMWSNIVLAGGPTQAPGFDARLREELILIAPEQHRNVINIVPSVTAYMIPRQQSSWIGGVIVSSMPAYKTSWITREEYEAEGEQILRRKLT